MKIKNILNRDLVNLTNCESEPIHVPGSIQPHGFLLAINAASFRIDYCSANSEVFIGLSPQLILGKHFSDIFSDGQQQRLEIYIKQDIIDTAQPLVLTFEDIPYNTTVHKAGEVFLLELELFPDGTLDLPNLYNQTRKFVALMEGSHRLVELCQSIAEETRSITGYDRVMIYRFDAQYNGEVIAESKREYLNSLSGQKYPHTDIPPQARELYIRNQIRMIADINYEPVPLFTIEGTETKDNKSLDLSLSILRSVSPIHIEYLKNMGVGATLTISLMRDGKLWGLIACHHYSPKILPHYTRLSALLQGHFLASQITVREVAEEFEIAQKVENALHELLILLQDNEDFIADFFASPLLLNLGNASGVIILYNGKIYKNGVTPEDSDIIRLTDWFSQNHVNNHLHTSNLIDIYPDGENLSKYAAGVTYHSMGNSDCILWIRSELVQTINWAGNPHKAVQVNETGARLSPRKSFELWMEEVKNKSLDWRKSELNATSGFAFALQRHINLHFVRSQEEQYRILNEELKTANKELANLNWISTHDLKEPLRKIQIFASKILDPANTDLSGAIRDSVGRMRFAAEKMQRLIEDILNYSRAGNLEKVFEETDLDLVLRDVLAEMKEETDEKNATIKFDKLPVLQVIPFQINQLFVNLISNSLNFVRTGVTPQIEIRLTQISGEAVPDLKPEASETYYKISFSDNGIGFDSEYRQKIFDVFQRLHSSQKYPGTGIGLAICKKIIENHNGRISADSVHGEGAEFTIYLPANARPDLSFSPEA